MRDVNGDAGVYYRPEDYVPFARRLLIDLIDTSLLTLFCAPVSIALAFLWPHEESVGILILATWAVPWFCYFVLLKRSRFRTLGYILLGARIVNLRGERPSIASLTARLLFIVAGPANVLIDLFWIPSDPCHQAIRDKFAHTYVIRRAAEPAGVGKIAYRTYTMFGATLLFQEVQTPLQPQPNSA
jgi:uncharacterized RDD family membrane protein YckC